MSAASLPTQILDDINDAAARLKRGQLVAFPTETVYGLGANALDPLAVARIFEAKQRPSFDPLIVHVADVQCISEVAVDLPDPGQLLADKFWPGPMTLVLPRTSQIPDLVTSGLPGVGVRIPQHPIARQLLAAAAIPVAAPSANPFGGVSPTTVQHVSEGLDGRIDAILDGGPCSIGLESTVISLMDDDPVVLRLGGLSIEDIEKVIGAVSIAEADPERQDAAQAAPGMLSRHYAPKTPIVLCDVEAQIEPTSPQDALLTWGPRRKHDEQFAFQKRLSEASDLAECAANFFAALRSLDAHNPRAIIARRFPDHGLGRALNDRLNRAAN